MSHSSILGIPFSLNILGIDVNSKEKRIQEIADKADEYSTRGDKHESVEILHAGLREFPNSYKLMRALAYDLLYPQKGDTPDEVNSRVEERKTLLERIVEGCTDTRILNFSIADLCEIYAQNGRSEEALKLAEKVPSQYYTQDDILFKIYRGTKQFELGKLMLSKTKDRLLFQMNDITYVKPDDGFPAFSCEQIIEIIKKRISFIELFYENGDYQEDNFDLAGGHTRLALIYAGMSDAENTLKHLKSMATAAIKSDEFFENQWGYTTMPPEKHHTSLLAHNPEISWCCTSSSENTSFDKLQILSNACFDFIRSDPGFISVENELKKYAKK